MEKPTTIDEYITSQPKSVQAILQEIREVIRAAAPDAEEGIGYSMPAFRQNGVLIYFAATKHHLSLFPTPSALTAFTDELARYDCSKGTIRLPLEGPIPADLITRIVHFKVNENTQKKRSR